MIGDADGRNRLKGFAVMEEMIRINKYLSEKGICSRREADELVEAGEVTVNGVPALMGQRITGDEEIAVKGVPVSHRQVKPVLIAVNKPRGIVCTTAEFPGEQNIVDLVDYPTRLYPVGRLDKSSEGLILMTNQGELVNQILKSTNDHEKEYVVQTHEQVTEELLSRLRQGVYLEDLDQTTKPCRCMKTGNREFHIILTQGLNRQIRRMCEAVGLHVENLRRIRIMNISLGNLPQGKYRNISGSEYERLLKDLQGGQDERKPEDKADHSAGKAVPAKATGKTMKAPQRKAEGKATQRKAEGKTTQNSAEGKATPRRAEGKAPHNMAEGKAPQSRAEGKATPNRTEGKAPKNRAEGKATQRMAAGSARAKTDRSAGSKSSGRSEKPARKNGRSNG